MCVWYVPHEGYTHVMNILTNVRLVMTDLLVANCGLHGLNETEHLYNVIHYYGDTCALYIHNNTLIIGLLGLDCQD